jgi:hypothetical protein
MKGVIIMAKVKILGNMFQLKSELKVSDIEKVEKYAPEALKIVDDNGNEVFGICMGSPSITKYGVSFDGEDEAGFAYLSAASNKELTKEAVVEEFAYSISMLNIIEKSIKDTMEHFTELEAEVMASIEEV